MMASAFLYLWDVVGDPDAEAAVAAVRAAAPDARSAGPPTAASERTADGKSSESLRDRARRRE
ncbi:hypothetical protein [Streptomyces sp. NBC_00829]|uniref:hypothetical protein n=1 Tax=Streptomyces sp. NBC_00829 TaxID=2903679 RepID=UPI00386E4046|nr:hypothetical protein OG293_28235 [Streptomyces sp. NBC_00829]